MSCASASYNIIMLQAHWCASVCNLTSTLIGKHILLIAPLCVWLYTVFTLMLWYFCSPSLSASYGSMCTLFVFVWLLPPKGSPLWALITGGSWRVTPTTPPFCGVWRPQWPWTCTVSVSTFLQTDSQRPLSWKKETRCTNTLKRTGTQPHRGSRVSGLVHSVCVSGPRRNIQPEGKLTPTLSHCDSASITECCPYWAEIDVNKAGRQGCFVQ